MLGRRVYLLVARGAPGRPRRARRALLVAAAARRHHAARRGDAGGNRAGVRACTVRAAARSRSSTNRWRPRGARTAASTWPTPRTTGSWCSTARAATFSSSASSASPSRSAGSQGHVEAGPTQLPDRRRHRRQRRRLRRRLQQRLDLGVRRQGHVPPAVPRPVPPDRPRQLGCGQQRHRRDRGRGVRRQGLRDRRVPGLRLRHAGQAAQAVRQARQRARTVSTTPTASRSTSEGRIFVTRLEPQPGHGVLSRRAGAVEHRQPRSRRSRRPAPTRSCCRAGSRCSPTESILVADPLAHQLVKLTTDGQARRRRTATAARSPVRSTSPTASRRRGDLDPDRRQGEQPGPGRQARRAVEAPARQRRSELPAGLDGLDASVAVQLRTRAW